MSKSQDQDFLLSDQKELTVKDSVEVFSLTYFPRIFTGKTTFLLRGIMSKFLLIPNFLNQVQKMYVCNQPKCEATFMRRLPTKLISTTAAPNFDHHIHC